ncbi:hypothetical protein L8V85_01530 [Campylobacter sp. IFREMER_LSEM_CL2090]|uniref:rolling circle replication-associated protein n=1 Tax=Campylobacter sp. IFREMER_LSEM_CL2090 TaxID=2911617 RepID=UPI0021E7CAB4|nr:hypothetical protein [Campylobacter sp. IFREMER_LSEM_CL2090]MCV3402640.1 hypothetical protein [Campylobacter sp. IFREMER_LSEM_CL2090]
MENNLFNQSINYNLKKDGIMSDAVAHNDSSCQFNKKLLPLSYGLSLKDLELCNLKLDNQRNYLSNRFYTSFTGEIKSFLDLSYSANFGKKYYAELVNRCNVISSLQFDYDLMPVFLTITLNGCFRNALKGDFTSFKPFDRKYLDYSLNYKININEAFTIKDLIKLLNYQWNLFIMRIHRKYKGLKKLYIRCFEPHKKDGVPHIHALIYIPKYAFNYTFEIYKKIFYAPQNLKQGNKLTKEQVLNGEINGFQWSLNNPTGYVMKYIYKTFINFNDRHDLDFLSAWYVKHKVRRFLTSKTPVPLWIYRKINFFKKDFYNLFDFINNDDCVCEWSFDKQYFCFMNDKETIEYDNCKLIYKFMGRIVYQYEKEKHPKLYKRYKKISFKKRENTGILSVMRNNKHPLSDYALMKLIQSDDFKYCGIDGKILYHVNLAIERGLIDAKKIKINDIDDLEDYLIEKGYKYVF